MAPQKEAIIDLTMSSDGEEQQQRPPKRQRRAPGPPPASSDDDWGILEVHDNQPAAEAAPARPLGPEEDLEVVAEAGTGRRMPEFMEGSPKPAEAISAVATAFRRCRWRCRQRRVACRPSAVAAPPSARCTLRCRRPPPRRVAPPSCSLEQGHAPRARRLRAAPLPEDRGCRQRQALRQGGSKGEQQSGRCITALQHPRPRPLRRRHPLHPSPLLLSASATCATAWPGSAESGALAWRTPTTATRTRAAAFLRPSRARARQRQTVQP